jgi:hypothetical protein
VSFSDYLLSHTFWKCKQCFTFCRFWIANCRFVECALHYVVRCHKLKREYAPPNRPTMDCAGGGISTGFLSITAQLSPEQH